MEILDDREAWLAAYRAGWLAHYEATGETKWDLYIRPRNAAAPAGPGIDLSRSRLLFITSAGGYLAAEQQPFDAENDLGDYTLRTFPSSTPLDALAFAHTHYDHRFIDEDQQVLVPLRHLEELVAEGVMGELAPNALSFMGYQPDVSRVLDELVPAVLEAARTEEAQGALLVPA